MSPTARLVGIRHLLQTFPGFSKSKVKDTTKAERYVTPTGMPIVLEPRGTHHNNIWVRSDSVDLTILSGVQREIYPDASEGDSRPNHHLFSDPLLKRVDLIRFKITSLGEARRVIEASVLAGVLP